jgi:type II restriction enzyme
MNQLCKLLKLKDEDELFDKITQSFKVKITRWDYFVNWKKVFKNLEPIEKELNLLNSLIGKEDIESEAYKLIKQYPEVIKAFPILIAIRENSVDILIDSKDFIYINHSFSHRKLSEKECKELAYFVVHSGIGAILKDRKVKNLVDYATGVEVGLDSNGRKNRGGELMESLVEDFVSETCKKLNLKYMRQATAKRIEEEWGIDVKVDKSSRQIDFAINKKGKLYFIECNFYGGGGSKLKSTATEYIEMNRYWNKQGIVFIWITDGAGWKSTLKPLREYFDKADYLLNLEMLKENCLNSIVSSNEF